MLQQEARESRIDKAINQIEAHLYYEHYYSFPSGDMLPRLKSALLAGELFAFHGPIKIQGCPYQCSVTVRIDNKHYPSWAYLTIVSVADKAVSLSHSFDLTGDGVIKEA